MAGNNNGRLTNAIGESLSPAAIKLTVPLEAFRRRYNEVRPHWALEPPEGGDPITPVDVYVHGLAVGLPKWQGWAKAARAKLEQMTEDMHFPFPAGLAPQPAA